MTDTRLFPKNYLLHLKLKNEINYLNDDIKRKLHRFPYRYRLANSYEGIIADHAITNRTLIGYESGMKVFLAYTCYEQIVFVANSLKINNVKAKALNQILNNDVCEKLISNKSFVKMIQEAYANGLAKEEPLNKDTTSSNSHLTNSLDKFLNNKSSDVLCLAYAIRNLFAHGEFTGGGSGATSTSVKELYYDIAHEVLCYSDMLYGKCLTSINLKK